MNFFDPTTFYTLHEAFYRTGRAMFGSTWQGSEVWSQPKGDPAELARERASKLKVLGALEDEIAPLYAQTKAIHPSEVREAAHEALQPLYKQRYELTDWLHHYPTTYDSFIKSTEAFERRQQVEAELRTAFESQALYLTYRDGLTITWNNFKDDPQFRLFCDLSIVRITRPYGGGPRRFPAYIARKAFDDWVLRFRADTSDPSDLSTEEQARLWFLEQVKQVGPKRQFFEQTQETARARFPDLSKRAFRRIWDNHAPGHWKDGGRPKKE